MNTTQKKEFVKTISRIQLGIALIILALVVQLGMAIYELMGCIK